MTPVTKHEQCNVHAGIRSSNHACDACGVRGNTVLELSRTHGQRSFHDPTWSEGNTKNRSPDFFACIIHVYVMKGESSNRKSKVVHDPSATCADTSRGCLKTHARDDIQQTIKEKHVRQNRCMHPLSCIHQRWRVKSHQELSGGLHGFPLHHVILRLSLNVEPMLKTS